MEVKKLRQYNCLSLGFGGFSIYCMAMGLGVSNFQGGSSLGRLIVVLGALGLVGAIAFALAVRAKPPAPRAPLKGFVRTTPTRSKIVIHANTVRCPYCHDGLAGPTSECSGCKARLHEDCLTEAKGCVTLGCVNRPPKPRVRT